MDLMALGIAFLVTIVCSILVFFISVYGTKEVSFEENLKASQIPGNSNKKKAQESRKKAKKVQKSEAESVSTPIILVKYFLHLYLFWMKQATPVKIANTLPVWKYQIQTNFT